MAAGWASCCVPAGKPPAGCSPEGQHPRLPCSRPARISLVMLSSCLPWWPSAKVLITTFWTTSSSRS